MAGSMASWMGKRLEDHTKEELLVVVEQLATFYEERIAGLYQMLDLERSGQRPVSPWGAAAGRHGPPYPAPAGHKWVIGRSFWDHRSIPAIQRGGPDSWTLLRDDQDWIDGQIVTRLVSRPAIG